MNVKGMIFAAGIGSRLRPLTDTVPKALVEVGGVTMLERNIRRLTEAGVTDITVNVHHHAALVKEWIAANAPRLGAAITVSDESDILLDTGGGLLKAMPRLADCDAILLHNADIYTDVPLRPIINAHLSRTAIDELPAVTLAVARRDTSRHLLFDSEGRMRGWQNSVTGELRPAGLDAEGLTPLGFLGIHVVSPAIGPLLRGYAGANGSEVYSLTPFYVANAGAIDIRAHMAEGHTWIDIGRPETLARARAHAEAHAGVRAK